CAECLGEEETIQHFIYECPEFEEARSILRRATGRAFYSLTYLFSDKKGSSHFIKFVCATGHIQ
ncbi:hypothetical protein K488DRAFT_25512, partial [Vararia minispora EC-137]